MPPHTNREIAFASAKLRLGKRASTAPTCRLAILDALGQLPNDIVTTGQVHDYLARAGIDYPRSTVYKTILRMSNAEDTLLRVDGGFQVIATGPGLA